MTVGSLFSGIGGIDLGLERAGMEIRWQVEIDEFCQKVLAKHWPNVKRFGDVRELTGDELEPVDLICGGFPCQPVSQAGRRKGQEDPRWLWPEFARIVRVVRPRYVLVENVPGLLTLGMGQVLGDLAALGYDTEWDCIPAAAFGAPHIRERVFIVAYTTSFRCKFTIYEESMENSTWKANEFSTSRTCFCIFNGCIKRERWWLSEPNMDRVAHGVPHRVDRLRALGNAVVPQVAEWIGKCILEFEKQIGDAANGREIAKVYTD